MDKKIFLCAALLLLLASCTATDPKEQYLSHVIKAKDAKEYKVVYDLRLEMLGQYASSSNIKLGVFRKGNNMKSVAEISLMGTGTTYSAYDMNGRHISCNKGGAALLGAGSETSCTTEKSSDSSIQVLFDTASSEKTLEQLRASDSFNVTYAGKKTIAERECDMYMIHASDLLKLMNLSEIAGDAKKDGQSAVMFACLDRETGITLFYNLSTEAVSELTEEGVYSPVMTVSAVSYSGKVDDSVFAIPVRFSVIKSSCNQDRVYALVESYSDFDAKAELKVQSSGYDSKVNETITLPEGHFSAFSPQLLAFSHRMASYGSYKVCLQDECLSQYCSQEDKCIQHSTKKEDCEADSECVYNDPVCSRFDCYSLHDQESCKSNLNCFWSAYSGGSGYCTKKDCYLLKTEAECSTMESCKWDSDYCSARTCYDLKTQQECSSSKLNCEWSDGYCMQYPCYSKYTQADCEKTDKCRWSGGYCYANTDLG